MGNEGWEREMRGDGYLILLFGHILEENISGANHSLRVNHANFNLGHRINVQWEGAQGRGEFWVGNETVSMVMQVLHL